MPANNSDDYHLLLMITKLIVRTRAKVCGELLQQRLNMLPVRAGSLLQQI